jgi:peptide/nickel transport system substrate-binding protein
MSKGADPEVGRCADDADDRHNEITRRQFVGQGASAASIFALGGLLKPFGGRIPAKSTSSTVPRGGRLRVGMTGNGGLETFNPATANADIDAAHVLQVFEPLTNYDDNGRVVNLLAEEILPNKALDEWTVRLPAGVELHNGKTLSADDVIYTFAYNLNPKNAALGSASLAQVDLRRTKKLDKRTLRVKLTRPNSFFRESVAGFNLAIFPVGQKDFSHPVGTGPFKLKSFSPGHRAELTAFKNYRQHGKPYVDELAIVSIVDPQARVNALTSRQVDLIAGVPAVLASNIRNTSGLKLLEAEGGLWPGQYMFTSGPAAGPFSDVRVRQALRLLVDREQIVKNVYLGHARLGNDIYGWNDPSYPHDLPQRKYDPEQARSLLKAAGHEKLVVDLYTSNFLAGLLELSTLMAAQAKKAGVTINIHNVTPDTYFTRIYLKKPFASTYWPGYSFVNEAILNLVNGATVNETKWRDPRWQSLFGQALQTANRTKASELLAEAQRVFYHRGGYIIPTFPHFLDASTAHVGGIHKSVVEALGWYNFRDAFLH